jgi:hypothetical protein
MELRRQREQRGKPACDDGCHSNSVHDALLEVDAAADSPPDARDAAPVERR